MAPLLSFKCVSATVSERLVHISDCDDTVVFELDEAAMLRNWLNAVLATAEQRCPHGYTIANLQNGSDTCRGCSELETGTARRCRCGQVEWEGGARRISCGDGSDHYVDLDCVSAANR